MHSVRGWASIPSGFDPARLRRVTGLDGDAAILSKDGAQFDPYRACVGISSGLAAGAMVFERSEVRRIEEDTRWSAHSNA